MIDPIRRISSLTFGPNGFVCGFLFFQRCVSLGSCFRTTFDFLVFPGALGPRVQFLVYDGSKWPLIEPAVRNSIVSERCVPLSVYPFAGHGYVFISVLLYRRDISFHRSDILSDRKWTESGNLKGSRSILFETACVRIVPCDNSNSPHLVVVISAQGTRVQFSSFIGALVLDLVSGQPLTSLFFRVPWVLFPGIPVVAAVKRSAARIEYQGNEADIICLDTGHNEGIGFLFDPRRVNVALTRAKKLLVILLNSSIDLRNAGGSGQRYWQNLRQVLCNCNCLWHIGCIDNPDLQAEEIVTCLRGAPTLQSDAVEKAFAAKQQFFNNYMFRVAGSILNAGLIEESDDDVMVEQYKNHELWKEADEELWKEAEQEAEDAQALYDADLEQEEMEVDLVSLPTAAQAAHSSGDLN